MPLTPEALDEEILGVIEEGVCPDEKFNEIALCLFTYQFHHNDPYRAFCRRRGITPETISHWSQIPPVPTQAFKVLDLVCEPKGKAQALFLSSGTTRGERNRSHHYLFNLSLYETSVLRWFEPHLVPERKPLRTLILFPPPQELPHSSLGYMLATVAKVWGKGEGEIWFVREGKLLADALASSLQDAERKGEPVMLLGTSLSFVHFLGQCRQNRKTFDLPEGSRLMDTGGFKGLSREVSRDELYSLYEKVLGIPRDWCVNEYGMAELSSQCYDGTVGLPYPSPIPRSRRYVPAPWMRTRLLDPETLEEVGEGEKGILCHYDLANRGSVMAVLTEDWGIKVKGGFVLLGRAPDTELRGCSVLLDELLRLGSVREGEKGHGKAPGPLRRPAQPEGNEVSSGNLEGFDGTLCRHGQ